MSDEYDVVIIGAGAAGIAAARTLRAAGLSLLILEANHRIGGRAHTVTCEGWPIDLGCGWLHSADRNPWTVLAGTLGFDVDRSPPPWGHRFLELGFPTSEQHAARAALEAFDGQVRSSQPATDRAADLLHGAQTWLPFLEAYSSYVNGAQLSEVSIADYRAYITADTRTNWRLPQGYGALIEAAGRALPVRLGIAATAIEAHERRLSVLTTAGRIETPRVIITISTGLLASGALRLPYAVDNRIDAAGRLPLGLADKVWFHLDAPDGFEPDTQAIGNPHRTRTGSYQIRPFGRPLIEGFVGGAAARDLEDGDDLADFAILELVGLFGADIKRRLRLATCSRWGRDPFARGAYSHALPGCSDYRAVLAAPWEDRIYFAGEACAPSDYSTAHGAYDSGVTAARLILDRQSWRP